MYVLIDFDCIHTSDCCMYVHVHTHTHTHTHTHQYYYYMYYVLKATYVLKALLPVCMKYTAQDESRVANIAQGEASAIFVTRLSSRAIYFHKMPVF